LNPTATGIGSGGPTVETRGAVGGTAGPGVQRVQVDFNGAITLNNAANITVTYRVTTPQNPSPIMGGPIVTVPTSVTLADADTLNITFGINQIPNLSCININIGAGTLVETITGDTDCNIRSLSGDTTGNGIVQLGDQLQVKNTTTFAGNHRMDINLNAAIQISDWLAIKNQISNPSKQAVCP
jgi:hypothetical protein